MKYANIDQGTIGKVVKMRTAFVGDYAAQDYAKFLKKHLTHLKNEHAHKEEKKEAKKRFKKYKPRKRQKQ